MSSTTTKRTRSDGERSRNAILRTAASLATVEGLEGISIGNLAAHIGMSKSGLYAHFRSKEQLQLETVDTAVEIFNTEVVEPSETVSDPLGQLRALLEHFLDHVERRVFPGGCFFASVKAEFDMHPGPVRDKVVAVQDGWTERVESLIHKAQDEGSLSAEEDTTQLAFDLTAYALMGNTGFVLYDDPAYLHRARAAIERRLSAAGGRTDAETPPARSR
jgi:AcrR family transcriptional regulator